MVVNAKWIPKSISDLPNWKGVPLIGLDTETCDPDLKKMGPGVRTNGRMVGISFAWDDDHSFYLPFGHMLGGNLDREQVLAYIRHQAKHYDGEITGANLQYDLDYLAEEDIEFPDIKFFRDVQVAAPIINEHHLNYSLNHILERLDLPLKDETALNAAAEALGIDPKAELYKMHADDVAEYAAGDALKPVRAYNLQKKEIADQDLGAIFDLECQVQPILLKLRRRGVRVDMDRLDKNEKWFKVEEDKALAAMSHESGVKLLSEDINKSRMVGAVFEAIGITLPTTPKTGFPSTKAAVIDLIDHPVAKLYQRAKRFNKLRTTFVKSVRRYEVNGRIHASYNQLRRQKDEWSTGTAGTISGRLSCENPNLQQQPARDEETGKPWRSQYLPEEGALWAADDYSQQEPRLMAHYASKTVNLDSARAAAQAYHDDPDLDMHQWMSDLCGLKRKRAKNIYLGICYGMGGAKYCRENGLPTRWAVAWWSNNGRKVEYCDTEQVAMQRTAQKEDYERAYYWEAAGEEGQSHLDQVNEHAPFVKALAKKAETHARACGYVRTILGRVCRFEKIGNKYDRIYKALNKLIQGSAADQMKKAMVELDKAKFWMQIQVHDEVGLSIASRKEAEDAAEIMENVVPLNVPSKVDVEIGPSWGEAA